METVDRLERRFYHRRPFTQFMYRSRTYADIRQPTIRLFDAGVEFKRAEVKMEYVYLTVIVGFVGLFMFLPIWLLQWSDRLRVKECRSCGESINNNAMVCPYCQLPLTSTA